MILQGDARRLQGPMFANESFDHVLSHPPYKDCVTYSTHIDGMSSKTRTLALSTLLSLTKHTSYHQVTSRDLGIQPTFSAR